jgi:lysozyme family protein
MNFEHAFAIVIGHEGGYVNHPSDPGGETKYGISKRSYPALDIATLTLDDARAIYRRDYWNRIKGDDLPPHVAVQVFDAAVNHGCGQAIRLLQRACGVSEDGLIGPVTLATAQAMDPLRFLCRFNAARLEFYTDLPTWPTFGRGWARRVAKNLKGDL